MEDGTKKFHPSKHFPNAEQNTTFHGKQAYLYNQAIATATKLRGKPTIFTK